MALRRRRAAELHSIFQRTVHEQRRALYAWSVGLLGLALAMSALYPTIRGNANLASLHESYPKVLRSLFGISDLTTGTGFLRAEVFSLIAPMLVIILGVLWGSDTIAGEEDRKTIDILLSNPITRRRVLLEKWAALLVGLIAVMGALTIGFAIGIPAVGLQIAWSKIAAVTVATTLLGLVFATAALAFGAATGRRGLARGLTALGAVLAYLVSSLAGVVGWLQPLRPISPWYHALGIDPLTAGFQLEHLFVLLLIVAASLFAGLVVFDRRDLAV